MILLTADRELLPLLWVFAAGVTDRILDDDRVVPMHSFKHAATLQHLLPHNPHPLLLRVDKKAGHGAGKSTEQKYTEFTYSMPRYLHSKDAIAFLQDQRGCR